MQNRLSGVDNGIRLAGDPLHRGPPKLGVEMIIELSLLRQCYVRRVVFLAFDWFVSSIEIPFQVVRSKFSRVFAKFIHS